MAAQENVVRKSSGGKFSFFLAIILVFVILVIAGFAYMQYAIFKVKAEGIAIGYQRAASAAYQMGRPIPDSIFEDGNYRVEVKTNFNASGTPSEVTVNVKDLYTNTTHYSSSRNLSSLPSNQNNNSIPQVQGTQNP